MSGVNRHTGAPLDGDAHIVQSVGDILSTRIGTRVERRDYGSRLPDLIDAPMTPSTIVEIYAATASALRKHEPRLAVVRVQAHSPESGGRINLAIAARKKADGAWLDITAAL